MNFPGFIFVLLWLAVLVNPAFCQAYGLSDENGPAARGSRVRLIKTGILRDIAGFPPPHQARYYAELSNILWDSDQKEALVYLQKSVAIALAPRTRFKTTKDRVEAITTILISNKLLKRDERFGKQLLSVLSKTIFDEIRKGSDEYGDLLITLANHVFRKDEKLGFELALLSLKGNKPAINAFSFNFMWLARDRKPFADQFYARMIEAVKTVGKSEYVMELCRLAYNSTRPGSQPSQLTEQQETVLLELLLHFIQVEEREVSLGKRNDCALIRNYGAKKLSVYKKLLPGKSEMVERAYRTCEMSAIDPRKKPGFIWKRFITIEEFLEAAGTTEDKELQFSYLSTAALLAHRQKNYSRSIAIIEQVDPDMRQKMSLWNTLRLLPARELIGQLFVAEDYDGVSGVIDNVPQYLRPNLIIDTVRSAPNSALENKQWALDLLSRAKTEFQTMGVPLPIDKTDYYSKNPAKYRELVDSYLRLNEPAEALKTFEEYVKIQNTLSSRFTQTDEKGTICYFYYLKIDPKFLNAYFDRIYENIGKLEAPAIRLRVRLNLLDENLHIAFNGSPGTIVLSY